MWYSKVKGIDQDKLTCPGCSAKFISGPLFDHDPRNCLRCGTKLIEWNLVSDIILIDVEQAPPVIRSIIHALAPLTEPDAEVQVKALAGLFNKHQL
jgi:hypothetical protein